MILHLESTLKIVLMVALGKQGLSPAKLVPQPRGDGCCQLCVWNHGLLSLLLDFGAGEVSSDDLGRVLLSDRLQIRVLSPCALSWGCLREAREKTPCDPCSSKVHAMQLDSAVGGAYAGGEAAGEERGRDPESGAVLASGRRRERL